MTASPTEPQRARPLGVAASATPPRSFTDLRRPAAIGVVTFTRRRQGRFETVRAFVTACGPRLVLGAEHWGIPDGGVVEFIGGITRVIQRQTVSRSEWRIRLPNGNPHPTTMGLLNEPVPAALVMPVASELPRTPTTTRPVMTMTMRGVKGPVDLGVPTLPLVSAMGFRGELGRRGDSGGAWWWPTPTGFVYVGGYEFARSAAVVTPYLDQFDRVADAWSTPRLLRRAIDEDRGTTTATVGRERDDSESAREAAGHEG